MLQRNIFANISPLDHRYSLREEEYKQMARYLSERAFIKYQARVELALVKTLAQRGICPWVVVEEVEAATKEITAEEVYQEEAKIKHNIRALVNCLQRKVSTRARPYIHFTATSFDIIDTANALRYQEVARELIIPTLLQLEESLMEIALREKDTLQIGRTHGQHAVPITFGFALAEYVSRLGNRIEAIKETSSQLRGKMAGAVGAYNASSLIFEDPQDFEAEVLGELGLKAGTYSSQIVEPEYMTDFLHSLISTLGVLASLSDDMRHLQRTEIAEVGEYFAEEQVGSSTMPHKRNPINYENVKSLWKVMMPGMITQYLDQLSEHQRDLTNSASSRFVPELIAGLLAASNRLIRVFSRLMVDKANLARNFAVSKEMIIAEPLYILLASQGHPDAHEAVRKLTLKSQKSQKNLQELMQEDEELSAYWLKFSPEQREIINDPSLYTGRAEEKTSQVVAYWRERLFK